MQQTMRRFAIVDLNSVRMAVPLDLVAEIIKPLPVTPLPHSDVSLLGIFNLRGKIVPLYDCSTLLEQNGGGVPVEPGRSRFLIVHADRRVLGVRVDRVEAIVQVRESDICDERLHWKSQSASDTDEIPLLDPGRLLPTAEKAAVQDGLGLWFDDDLPAEAVEKEPHEKPLPVLIVRADRQDYALELGAVSELIRVEAMEAIPDAADYSIAMTVHRNQPLHLIDLCTLAGLVPSPRPHRFDPHCRQFALILNFEGPPVGLVVDELVEIRDIEQAELLREPQVMAAFGKEIQAVIDQDGGRHLIPLLDHVWLHSRLDRAYLQNILDRKAAALEVAYPVGERKARSRKLLQFSLLNGLYALPVEEIREIITLSDLTPVPDSGRHLAGLTNVRGVVFSVVDLKTVLGRHSLEREAENLRQEVSQWLAELSPDRGGAQADRDNRAAWLTQKTAVSLQRRGDLKLFGSRACRQLLADIPNTQIDPVFLLEEFERLLMTEVRALTTAPKLLVMAGSDPRALLVDSVRSVVEIDEASIEWTAAEERDGCISGSFIGGQEVDRIIILDLNGIMSDQSRVRIDD